MEFKISFVVPCYNVREYISECLGSLVSVVEKYGCEVVVVDDGSTDTTLKELKRWEKTFPSESYVVIAQENQGLSGARNSGIKKARGEYIFLLDSDDYLNVHQFPVLVDELEATGVDALFFNYYTLGGPDWYWESGQLTLPSKKVITDRLTVKKSLYRDQQFYAWAKVFKRALYDDVEFPVGRNFEDISTIPRLVDKITSLYYLPCPMVFYRQRDGSIVKQKTEKNILDLSASLVSQGIPIDDDEGVAWDQIELSVYIVIWSLIDLSQSNLVSDVDGVVDKIKEDQSNFVGDRFSWYLKECFKKRRYRLWLKSFMSYSFPRLYFKYCVYKYAK